MFSIRDGLALDDILLTPKYSEIKSRSNVDTSVTIKGIKYKHPIIPANMQSITEEKMAEVVVRSGGLAIVHRFMPIEDQLKIIDALDININDKLCLDFDGNPFGEQINVLDYLAFSVGVKEKDKENVKKFINKGVKILCIDIAHGDSRNATEMTEFIRWHYPDTTIIAGNVATGSGAKRLWDSGADVVKCGIGSGSICTTRIATGNGVPQLSALMDVAIAREEYEKSHKNRKIYIMADGGAKNSGDCIKSLCLADLVMCGAIFAGALETPGNIFSFSKETSYKEYRGSSTHKTNHIEGVVSMVPVKGSFESILNKLLEGIKSGCSYQGVDNLIDLRESPEFIKITGSGLIESHPHIEGLK
jgi:IMP dehydrogenase